MHKLYQPEVVRSVSGHGWTVVRGGRDAEGSYQEWIGENFEWFNDAEKASVMWELSEPSFEVERNP